MSQTRFNSPERRECQQDSQEEQASNPVLETRNGDIHVKIKATGEDSEDTGETDMGDQEGLVSVDPQN